MATIEELIVDLNGAQLFATHQGLYIGIRDYALELILQQKYSRRLCQKCFRAYQGLRTCLMT